MRTRYKLYAASLLSMCLFFAPFNVAAEDALPEGTISRGSLANEKLIHDAKVGIAAKVGAMGCDKPESSANYVVSMPVGEVGARSWVEKWLIKGCGSIYPVTIVFSEAGPNGANWSIQ